MYLVKHHKKFCNFQCAISQSPKHFSGDIYFLCSLMYAFTLSVSIVKLMNGRSVLIEYGDCICLRLQLHAHRHHTQHADKNAQTS